MSDALTIQFKGLAEAKSLFGGLAKKLERSIDTVLSKGTDIIITDAKKRVPVDMGLLRNSISAKKEYLFKTITVNAFYAPFIEFGTGKHAAEQMAKLPPDWVALASQFKGQKGGGDYYDFLNNILEWVKRVGIGNTMSTGIVSRSKKSGGGFELNLLKAAKPRTKKLKGDALADVAAAIAWSILRNGIHPRPFLYPAFMGAQPEIQKQITEVLQRLTQL
jgi:HK97 gp10 family phage protein